MQTGAGIVTVDQLRDQLGETSTITVARTRQLLRLIDASSRMITQFTRRSFVPFLDTRYYDARGAHIDTYNLRLDADLLSIDSLVNGDSATISSDDYVLRPSNNTPYHTIQLKQTSSSGWVYDDDWENAISVNGWWGFHETYALAWVGTNDTVQNAGGISDSDTTIEVVDADASDVDYMARFQVGGWLRINDEAMRIFEVDTTLNTITVLRGALGTTPASHDNGDSINKYHAQYDIAQACLGLAVWLERNKGATGENLMFVNGGEIRMNQVPDYIVNTIKAYRRAKAIAI